MTRNQTRAVGAGLGVGAIVLAAACSGGGGSPSVVTSPTPLATISPVATGLAVTAATIGVAYLPDGGNGQGFTGLQLVHFENTSSELEATSTTSSPGTVTFSGAVGPFAISLDGDTAIAAISRTASPPYTLVQSVYGTNANATVPVGTGYDVTQLPTAAPSPVATSTAAVGDLSSVTSLGIYGAASASQAVGVAVGPDATGILGVTQLSNAGPVYGGYVPFTGQSPEPAVSAARPHLVVGEASNASTMLVRGPSDLLSYAPSLGGNGYTFTLHAEDTTLGLGSTALGPGVMALDPADGTRAIVGQTNPGDGSLEGITLLTGLPDAITKSSTIDVGSVPRSVVITAGGGYAVVGTDAGFVVVSGVGGGTLAIVPSTIPAAGSTTIYSPSYTGCDGKTYALQNVTSVGFSADLNYLAVLGNQPSAACAEGRTATLIALPFDQTTGAVPTATPSPAASTTPAPTMFVQNNIIAPSAGQDYMYVR